MKKRLATFLLILYVIPTLGVTISWSYCNEAKMAANKMGKCVCKPGKPNEKCCDSKKYTFKFKDNQQKSNAALPKFSQAFDAIVVDEPHFEVLIPATERSVEKSRHLPRPPNLREQRLYILHQVFLI